MTSANTGQVNRQVCMFYLLKCTNKYAKSNYGGCSQHCLDHQVRPIMIYFPVIQSDGLFTYIPVVTNSEGISSLAISVIVLVLDSRLLCVC